MKRGKLAFYQQAAEGLAANFSQESRDLAAVLLAAGIFGHTNKPTLATVTGLHRDRVVKVLQDARDMGLQQYGLQASFDWDKPLAWVKEVMGRAGLLTLWDGHND